eukprot:6154574-Alexandrium_andersonii.AAC.1
MGGVLSANASPGLQIDARVSACVSAIDQVRKGALSCQSVPQSDCVQLHVSLCVSQLVYNAQIWGP